MKNNRIKGVTAAAFCACLLIGTGMGNDAVKAADNVLKVGVREAIAGFGYKNEISGTYSGMEIDLARKLAEALKYDAAEFVSVTAQTRENALENGDVDCVIATFTVTDERAENFDFSEPYYEDSLRVMTEKSSLITEPSDLKDMTVGVAEGSTAALALAQELATLGVIDPVGDDGFDAASFQNGIKFEEFDNYPDMETALESGEVDAICADGSILSGYLTEERQLLDLRFSQQQYAVATLKDSELSSKIDEVIAGWSEDGTLNILREKWDLD